MNKKIDDVFFAFDSSILILDELKEGLKKHECEFERFSSHNLRSYCCNPNTTALHGPGVSNCRSVYDGTPCPLGKPKLEDWCVRMFQVNQQLTLSDFLDRN